MLEGGPERSPCSAQEALWGPCLSFVGLWRLERWDWQRRKDDRLGACSGVSRLPPCILASEGGPVRVTGPAECGLRTGGFFLLSEGCLCIAVRGGVEETRGQLGPSSHERNLSSHENVASEGSPAWLSHSMAFCLLGAFSPMSDCRSYFKQALLASHCGVEAGTELGL